MNVDRVILSLRRQLQPRSIAGAPPFVVTLVTLTRAEARVCLEALERMHTDTTERGDAREDAK